MTKAEAYAKVREKIALRFGSSVAEEIFSEFEESEDERIRKDIMVLVKDWWDRVNKDNISTKEQMLAWLEKQGQVKESSISQHENETCKENNDSLTSEDERIRKDIIAFIKKRDRSGCDYDYDKWVVWLEKQKDTNVLIQEASEKAYTEGMRVERKHWLKKQGEQKSVESSRDYNDIDPHFGIPVEDLKSKEKTADKVEAKFHEGDWIVHHGTENIYQVVAVIDNQYQLKYGDNYTIQNCADVDRCARLWDVAKDTKDGDVLHLGCVIAIFKKYIGQEKCICYCSISEDEDFEIPTEDGEDNIYGCTNTTPATKEQRDTLFKAMADAGYIFDFENKELKKIEKKPSWSDEDEDNLRFSERHFKYFLTNSYYDTFCSWLKSLKERLSKR